ncbi:DNA translocase FtsK [Candidatus Uhrbacteria bacterium]|nr:DNA translocase FtsK [Candidatus Uhrbacteria bacterium]
MARAHTKSRSSLPPPRPRATLHPETKRGIGVIFVFALAAFLLLSFFGIAGSMGTLLDHAMAEAFGWDRFLVPVLLILGGTTALNPERMKYGLWNLIGVLCFFLSFNALLNTVLLSNVPLSDERVTAVGGLVGQLLATVLSNVAGFWATLTALLALFLISLLLTFNTSLRRLMGWYTHAVSLLRRLQERTSARSRSSSSVTEEHLKSEDKEEYEPSDEQVDQYEEEAIPTPSTPLKTHPVPAPEEKVLTTRLRRTASLPLDLLEYRTAKANSGDTERNQQIIQRTFEHFNIQVEMGEMAIGPTVTQYTLRPAEGVKLSRIVALQNDIALALASHPIRIEAPVPGKSLVGIEVPNQNVATVSLRELLESKAFKTRSNNLHVAMGKDVTGKVWNTPLDKMPHLLVAGATGSGKSVCLNTVIISLLYENSPDELRFVMVDPKRVELTAYEGIPHLLIPPITKVDDTVNALKWTVREMERRLDVLSKFGVRDIGSYNAKAEEKMPRIVVVVDELADLMAASGHEVEATIVRIAQMARAVGIHLVLATQRPSVDVITGVIKANFPARIAFAVASQTDSRTILDCAGAEKLLGRGDMLFTSAELSKPVRIQGAYVSEEEVKRVVAHLRLEGMPDYNYAVTEREKTGIVLDGSDGDDPLLDDAAVAVIQAGRASTSLLQRRLKIGYGRAARVLDILEDRGVIGPPDGSKPREILVDHWPLEDRREFAERRELLRIEDTEIPEAAPPSRPSADDPDLEAFLSAQQGTYPDDEKDRERTD